MGGGMTASIGVEVHAELMTESKMFCSCPVGFGGVPNSRVCPVCTAQPGSLPVPNRAAVEMVLRAALALNCTVPERSVFHRKNYFYPDLPKGYQISQYGETNPLGYDGWLEIPYGDGTKRVQIRRVHLEEDTGKLVHLPSGESGVDYNRAGVPLMEVVTEFPPDIHTAEEARAYLVQLRLVLVYLGVCDGKMEEGSLRGEPNISVAPPESASLGVKTELKNLSSFRAVYLGVQSEIDRQQAALNAGERVRQETRGWNEEKQSTFVMRVKEEENDYRYFPDPDLPPMAISREWLEGLRAAQPELPLAKRTRYQGELGLPEKDAAQLVADPGTTAYFERCVAAGADPKRACNWILGELTKLLNESGTASRDSRARPEHLVELLKLIDGGTISGPTAKELFALTFRAGRSPAELAKERGATQISDADVLRGHALEVIGRSPSEVQRYKGGNANVMGYFVGQVMKATQGRANPSVAQQILREELEKL